MFLVVGPTQCGKTFLVEKILTTDRIFLREQETEANMVVLQPVAG